MKLLTTRTFYGLKPLEAEDIDFFLTTPDHERGGAYSYEIRRQVYARALAKNIQTQLTPKEFDELGRYWQKAFLQPWPQVSSTFRQNWCQTYQARAGSQHLKWAHVTQGSPVSDPSPAEPGQLIVLKVDWDLPDAVICEMFKRSLKEGRPKMVVQNEYPVEIQEKMRPRAALTERQESHGQLLRAIACQRIFDLRGSQSPEVFAAEFLDDKLPKGQDALTLRRIDDSKEKYRALEECFEIESHGYESPDYTKNEAIDERKHLGFSLRYPAS